MKCKDLSAGITFPAIPRVKQNNVYFFALDFPKISFIVISTKELALFVT